MGLDDAQAIGSVPPGRGLVLGLDPGRDKIGFAIVEPDGELCLSGLFPTRDIDLVRVALTCGETLDDALSPWTIERPSPAADGKVVLVALGDGTSSAALDRELRAHLPWRMVRVDEHGTTLAARSLYWRLRRPPPWKRLLPRALWIPPRPLDDMAAWSIALRAIDASASSPDGRYDI